MRITASMLSKSVIDSINQSKSRLGKLQKILSTGKRVNKPSDDPLRISRALNLENDLRDTEQYLKNIDTADTWINLTAQTVDNIGEALNEAKIIALRESNATSTVDSKIISAEEVRNLKKQLMQLANTSYSGRYIFSGSKTLTQPFTENGDYEGNDKEINIQIGEKRTIAINVPGNKVFKEDEDIFAVLSELEEALENDDTQGINDKIEEIDSCIKQIRSWEGELGGRGKRIQVFQNRLKDRRVGMIKLLSYTEDADITEAVANLQSAGVAYQAALSAGRQILNFTMIEFWK